VEVVPEETEALVGPAAGAAAEAYAGAAEPGGRFLRDPFRCPPVPSIFGVGVGIGIGAREEQPRSRSVI